MPFKEIEINFLPKNIRSLILTISNLKLLKFKSTSYFSCSLCLSRLSFSLSLLVCRGIYVLWNREHMYILTHVKQSEEHYGCNSLGTFCFKTRSLSLSMSAGTEKNTTFNFLTTS